MKIRFPSHTAIDAFSRCPRQYAEDLIAGRTPATVAMERGIHLHNCLEAAANIVVGKAGDWKYALRCVKEAPPEGILGQPEVEDFLDRALPVVSRLEPVKGGVEAWFNETGAYNGLELDPLPIVGKIDLVSARSLLTTEQAWVHGEIDEPCVVDYKTISGEHRIKNSYEARRSMQLKIYCLAMGLRRAGFVYFPPKSPCRAVFVEFTDDDLRVAHRWLTMQLEAMLRCWAQFIGQPVEWGEEIFYEEGAEDWSAFPLSHPDNYLCSPKWCGHFSNCIGAEAQKG